MCVLWPLNLNALDMCAIPLKLTKNKSLMQQSYESLVHVHLTQYPNLEETVFRQSVTRRYLDCSFSIYMQP